MSAAEEENSVHFFIHCCFANYSLDVNPSFALLQCLCPSHTMMTVLLFLINEEDLIEDVETSFLNRCFGVRTGLSPFEISTSRSSSESQLLISSTYSSSRNWILIIFKIIAPYIRTTSIYITIIFTCNIFPNSLTNKLNRKKGKFNTHLLDSLVMPQIWNYLTRN